jgi:hypothetical protein
MPTKVAQIRPEGPESHLRPATRRWIEHVREHWVLDQHHDRLLVLAGEAFDRATAAREAIDKHGITYTDRFGAPRTRPEVAVERDARLAFARLLRQLDLDAPGVPSSPLALGPRRGGGRR